MRLCRRRFVSAERNVTGANDANGSCAWISSARSLCEYSPSSRTRSYLLPTITSALRSSSAMPASRRSWFVGPVSASINRIATSLRAIALSERSDE